MNATTPKFYRKEGAAIWRKSETTGTQVITPHLPQGKLPLSMTEVTYPCKERFDEAIKGWDEVDLDMFEQYVKNFCGRVLVDIDRPMTDRSIKKELEKQQNFLNHKSIIK